MSAAKPDMAKGTRNVALAINTSITDCDYEVVETPLGTRRSIILTTATGRTKEVALVQHAAYAGEIVRRMCNAIDELHAAAELIVRDREGGA